MPSTSEDIDSNPNNDTLDGTTHNTSCPPSSSPQPQRASSITPPSTQPHRYPAHTPTYTSIYNPPQGSPGSPAEVLGYPFSEFDHKGEVIEPFAALDNKDQAFQEELTSMLLDALLETHGWSIARPKQEAIAAAERFEASINCIMDVQQKQGTSLLISAFEKTREKLYESIAKIRSAIMALAGAMLV